MKKPRNSIEQVADFPGASWCQTWYPWKNQEHLRPGFAFACCWNCISMNRDGNCLASPIFCQKKRVSSHGWVVLKLAPEERNIRFTTRHPKFCKSFTVVFPHMREQLMRQQKRLWSVATFQRYLSGEQRWQRTFPFETVQQVSVHIVAVQPWSSQASQELQVWRYLVTPIVHHIFTCKFRGFLHQLHWCFTPDPLLHQEGCQLARRFSLVFQVMLGKPLLDATRPLSLCALCSWRTSHGSKLQ